MSLYILSRLGPYSFSSQIWSQNSAPAQVSVSVLATVRRHNIVDSSQILPSLSPPPSSETKKGNNRKQKQHQINSLANVQHHPTNFSITWVSICTIAQNSARQHVVK